MPGALLVLPASSYRGPDFVAAADRLGLSLVVATDGTVPDAWQLAGAVTTDLDDPVAAAAAIVPVARTVGVAGVVGVDDGGVLVASLVAEELELPGNDPASVRAARDKSLMRAAFATAGVPQPAFRVAERTGSVSEHGSDLGFPVVVKPVGLSGSRGVIRADDPAQAAAAEERIRAILEDAGGDPAGPLLVEAFVPGPEIAVEALVTPAEVEVLAVFDKPDPLDGPFFEETIYTTPSRHPSAAIAAAGRVVDEARRALGLAHGPVHAELRLTAEGPKMIELAARTIGGLCSRSLRFGMLGDVPLEELVLRAACGLPRRGMPRDARAAGVMMLPIPARGVLREVRGTESVWEVPGITGLEITIPRGRTVVPIPEGDRYLGFLFAGGDDPALVEAALREAHAGIEVVIEG